MTGEIFPATAMPDRVWWSVLWPAPRDVVRRLGIVGGMKVVDLCCGYGYFTAPLATLTHGTVYALDIDPELLSQARAEAARQQVSVAEWICADAREVAELVPHDIDYVLLTNTFHGVPDQTGLAHAVARVLKPDGRFVIVNWHQLPLEETTVLDKPRGPKTEMRMSPEDVLTVVEPAGFELEELIELPPYHYATILRRTAQENRL